MNLYTEKQVADMLGRSLSYLRAKLPGVNRYTIRHTMATEMRRRGVDMWEVEGWLGHRMPSTSERYAKFAPDYLGQGRKAIDDYFNELQKLVKYPLRLAVKSEKKRLSG